MLGQFAGLQLPLGQTHKPKPFRPKLAEQCLLRLSWRGDENGAGPEGREVQLRTVAAAAHDGSRALQRGGQLGIRGVAPRGDVAVLARPSAGLPRNDQARPFGIGHPSAQGRFHQRSMRLHAADHPHLGPGLGWVSLLVLGKPAEDADVLGARVDLRVGKGATQRHFARGQVGNPNLAERLCPTLNHAAGRAFQKFWRGDLELMRHQHGRDAGHHASVAIVRQDGVEVQGLGQLLGPCALAFDVGHKGRHLPRDAPKVASLGVLDVRSGLDVKREVGLVHLLRPGLQPRQGRAFGRDVHMPALPEGVLDERPRARGVPHAPIEHGHEELGSTLARHRG